MDERLTNETNIYRFVLLIVKISSIFNNCSPVLQSNQIKFHLIECYLNYFECISNKLINNFLIFYWMTRIDKKMISLSKKIKERKSEENNNQRKRPLIRDALLLKGLSERPLITSHSPIVRLSEQKYKKWSAKCQTRVQ